MDQQLRTIWRGLFRFDWRFGLFLVVLICVPRFYLVLKANETARYEMIGLVMVISAMLPYLFLNRDGRRQIGIHSIWRFRGAHLALIAGIAASLLLYLIGYVLYDSSYENWYVYIGQSYNVPDNVTSGRKLIIFLITAFVGMVFSPIGEEFYFRGIVHGSFATSLGEKRASLVDSTAFAITHIAHFGWVYIHGEWSYYVLPGLLWVVGMFGVSQLFFFLKSRYDSLWGAVVCHAGFNFGMIYSIFYLL